MSEGKTSFKKYIIILWSIFGFGILCLLTFFWLISAGKLGFMPSFDDLENPKTTLATEIYSDDGVRLTKLYRSDGNRTEVQFDDLGENLVTALVSTEDERYFDHSGIDLRGLVRVFKGVVTGNTSAGGGSTLSQQLAKNLFPRENLSKLGIIMRKFKEWVIAVKLERSYTKEEIIALYLNKVDFVHNAAGIHSAANIYFSKNPDNLSVEEAATIVGMLKNPSRLNPISYPKQSEARRNVVLYQMKRNHVLNQAQYDSLTQIPLVVKHRKVDHINTLAPHFMRDLRTRIQAKKPDRDNYRGWQMQQFIEDSLSWKNDPLYGWCNKNTKIDGSNYDIYEDGLKIYTTINSKMQRYAENAIKTHLQKDLQPLFQRKMKAFDNPPFSDDLDNDQINNIVNLQIKKSERYRVHRQQGLSNKQIMKKFDQEVEMQVFTWDGMVDTTMTPRDSIILDLKYLRASFMCMEPNTGYVRAWVGSGNFEYFRYDAVRQGKRQVGSTCKPFLYTLAMRSDKTPCSMVPNQPVTFKMGYGQDDWTAKNSDKSDYDGKMVSLKWGLANSVNQVSAQLMKEYNPIAMKRTMQKFGIYSPIDAVPSMFLGTSDISLYEMVTAYGAFANKGILTKPIMVTRIENKAGEVVAEFTPQRSDAIDETTAYKMVNLMQGVVNEGSGRRLLWHPEYGGFPRGLFSGKTGTTQNQSDGWFIGYNTELVAGAWAGGEVRSIHFADLKSGQGANMALPIFGRFFKAVYADTTLGYDIDARFEAPDGVYINFDCPNTSEEKQNNEEEIPEFDEFF